MESNLSQSEASIGIKPLEEKSTQLISGFWRRPFAFIIDGIILGVIGIVIGTSFFDFFAELGGWGRMIGFAMALLYFGALNSSIGNGQTIGKRMMKIRVVDGKGKLISPLRSVGRFMIIGPPYFLNEAIIPPSIATPSLSFIQDLFVSFMGCAIIYLYIFNRRTRQSLHDLMIGTYVVQTSHAAEFTLPQVWKGHLSVIGLLFVALIIHTTLMMPKLTDTELFYEVPTVQTSINDSGLVHMATVSIEKSPRINLGLEGKENTETTYLSTNAILKTRPEDHEEIIEEIASIIIGNYQTTMDKDSLIVRVTYGYDIGLASAWTSKRQQYSFNDWKAKLACGSTPK
jgi:uncharacterized RDD family membrane protein YckC